MDILLVGASVRAAAGSLARLGWRPTAFDLFNDLDLAAIADSTRLELADYPSQLTERLIHLAPMPWIYTGAMENHPAVVDAISQRFHLLGNDGSVLRRVKDPFQVAAIVQDAGLGTPEVRRDAAQLPTDGSWLAKPFQSGGGEGIKVWRGGSKPPNPDAVLYQQRVAGIACAAIFVRTGVSTQLAGVTRQYLGRIGNRFAYRGSLGPWPLVGAVDQEIADLGQAIGAGFGLSGVFGIDLVIDKEKVWMIEVNPRYTASVEILELALGRSIMAEHLLACGESADPGGPFTQPKSGREREFLGWQGSSDPGLQAAPNTDRGLKTPATQPKTKLLVSGDLRFKSISVRFVGKAVVFARGAGRLVEPIPVGVALGAVPEIADIPRVGTSFEPGHPILTVYGFGETPKACQLDLGRQLHHWKRRINLEPGSADLGIDHQEHGHGEDQDAENHPREPERLNGDLAE